MCGAAPSRDLKRRAWVPPPPTLQSPRPAQPLAKSASNALAYVTFPLLLAPCALPASHRYIFESNMVQLLLGLFPQAPFRNVSLQCLTEVRREASARALPRPLACCFRGSWPVSEWCSVAPGLLRWRPRTQGTHVLARAPHTHTHTITHSTHTSHTHTQSHTHTTHTQSQLARWRA